MAKAATTTIRVDEQTRDRLTELATADSASVVDTVRAAVDALERQRFVAATGEAFRRLRDEDPDGWAAYEAEAASTNVADGIG